MLHFMPTIQKRGNGFVMISVITIGPGIKLEESRIMTEIITNLREKEIERSEKEE